MNINIKSTNMEMTPAISDYATKKVESLGKFITVHDNIQAWIEIGKTTNHHQHGDIFRAELQMKIAGNSLRAESEKDDLYAAIDDMQEEMKRELLKFKDKRSTKKRRGERMLKKLLSVFYK